MFNVKIKSALNKAVPALFATQRFSKLLGDISAKTVGIPVLVSVGAKVSNAIAVTFQLTDPQGDNLAENRLVHYRVTSVLGGAPAGSPPSGGTAVSTGTLIKELTSGVCGVAETDATGKLVLTLTSTAGPAFYVSVSQGGPTVSSTIVQF